MKWMLISVVAMLAVSVQAQVTNSKPAAPAVKPSVKTNKPAATSPAKTSKSKAAAPAVTAAAPVVVTAPVIDPVVTVQEGLVALTNQNVAAAEEAWAKLTHPAAKLYLKACIERAKKDPKAAIQTVVQVIALYSADEYWMAKSELLSAALYIELGLLEEAEATALHVQELYKEMDVITEADALRSQIEKLKK